VDLSYLAPNQDTTVIQVAPSDVDHFEFAPLTGSVTSTAPFQVTILSRTTNGGIATTFSGPAALRAVGGLGLVDMTPTTTGAFEQGIWTGMLTINNGAHTDVRLIVEDTTGRTGQSASFAVYAPPLQQARILESAIVGAGFQLQFSSVSGRHYRLEASSDLSGAPWVTVTPDVIGTGGVVSLIETNGLEFTKRFYRITLQP
jgi:hypothetical protein